MFLQGHLHIFLYLVFTLVGQFFSGQALAIPENANVCPKMIKKEISASRLNELMFSD